MKLSNLSYLISLFVILNVPCDGSQVKVEQGILKGEVIDLVTGEGQYHSFKGIPYAKPPVGALRFKAPVPASSWDGIRNATQHGSVCPHIELLTNILMPGNEDCLFINVYTPNLKPETLLPVLVFIHGGGYKSGSGNVDSFGPDFLIRKNMVVVTFNYRLDALGFITLGTEDVPGNAGLKDQVLALKWVQKNIERFGGDRNKVTVMGQSAGGASVALHISSPMSKGLFKRAIVLSGSPICDWSVSFYPERRAFALGKKLGFETRNPDELLGFLQNVTADKLVNTSPNVFSYEEYTYNLLRMYQFVPVVEKYTGKNNFLTYDISKKVNHVNDVDILFGFTSQEAVPAIQAIVSIFLKNYNNYPELFVPRKILNGQEPSEILDLADEIRNYYLGNKSINVNAIKEFVNYSNYVAFNYDIIKYFTNLPVVKNTLRYLYKFSSISSRNVNAKAGEKYDIVGPGHIDDLVYLFDPKSLNLTLDMKSEEFRLIDQITTLFTNFAIHGNPTPDSSFNVTWPSYEKNTMKYLDIGNDLTILSVNDDDNVRFWDSIYSKVKARDARNCKNT